MPAPKIVFLVTEDWYFVSHRLELAVAAKAAGFEVTVITRANRHREMIEKAGLRLVPFDMDRRGMNPLGLLHEAWVLARIYRRERPEIVHHVALRPVVVGGLAARIAGVPAVVSAITGMGFLFTDGGRARQARTMLVRLMPWLLGKGLVVVQNATDAAQLTDWGVPESRLRHIPSSGVNVQRFTPTDRPANPQPIVMLPSRLLWDKGVGEFVEAAHKLQGRARFVLVGESDPGNPSAVSEDVLRTWQAEGLVEWWGKRDDMPAVLAKADIVCLPSYREGMPKVLLEAMACGKPCITTDAPGCRDCVRDGDNGLLVPVKDAGALAAAIARLLDDPGLRARMGRRGRERAEAEFASERIIAMTLDVYREMLR